MGLMSTLTLIFVVLKLAGLVNWSWLWVLSPTWLPAAILFVILIWIAGS